MTMGTAATMTALAHVLGMCLPGTSSIPAADSNHVRMCSAAGRRIVDMVWENLTPAGIMTKAAFHNAINAVMAMACSTNAVVHILAMGRRPGHAIGLEDFDAASRKIPVIANVRPSGHTDLMEDFYYAGGLLGLMSRVADHLDLEQISRATSAATAGFSRATSSRPTKAAISISWRRASASRSASLRSIELCGHSMPDQARSVHES